MDKFGQIRKKINSSKLYPDCIQIYTEYPTFILILSRFSPILIHIGMFKKYTKIYVSPVHVLLSRFYLDFIQILSRFFQKLTLSKFYPDFIQIFWKIWIKGLGQAFCTALHECLHLLNQKSLEICTCIFIH